MPIMVSKSLPYPCQVHKSRYHHKNMKNIVGTTPHVELARFDGLREAECVEGHAKNEDSAFKEVVRHAGLLPCLVEAIGHAAVDDRRETRQTGRDEDNGAESTPFSALEARVENEDGG